MGITEFHEKGLWLIGRISEQLLARQLRMGTAESCTGGLVAMLCTNVPGSSRWFSGSVVAYENRLKTGLLGIEPSLLEQYGAVSSQVVEAMARGALDALGVEASIAVSGIAGPDGGTREKPVGTVWIATAVLPQKSSAPLAPVVLSHCRHVPGDRYGVRFGAAMAALGALDNALSGSESARKEEGPAASL
jgi:PncC family amidohydrolase